MGARNLIRRISRLSSEASIAVDNDDKAKALEILEDLESAIEDLESNLEDMNCILNNMK